MAGPVTDFIKQHFRHFNAAALKAACDDYIRHLERGGVMFMTMAGAMSTAEIGLSLAEMIRKGKVHAITCTGANLEEDIFNLVAHDHYIQVPNYRQLRPEDEKALLDKHMNRVTDTCIPEGEAMRRIESAVLRHWVDKDRKNVRLFPHEFMYEILRDGSIQQSYQIDPKNSWMVAAAEKNLHTVRTGIEYMIALADWYTRTSSRSAIGFFQIGGGIAGDFPICVVPMLHQDLQRTGVPLWGYFCQISDSTTSYGSYSGAVPNEKITWGKLGVD